MSDAPRPTIAYVAVELIDDPELPSRENMSDDGLAELIESIELTGLIQPVVLERRGDRFRLMAGHRRLTAHRIMNAATVLSAIYAEGEVNPDVIQSHENSRREEVNPAEEAERLDRLYRERCGQDVDRVCQLVGESRAYVESRLLLKRGDPAVFAAVKSGTINQSVAALLNKITAADLRAYYLDAALKGGVSARVMREWVGQAERVIAARERGATDSAPADAPAASTIVTQWSCPCCLSPDDPFDTDWIQIHRSCWRAIVAPFLHRYQQSMGFDRDADERKANNATV